MDFTLSKEHEMARTLFRDFAEKEVKPLAQEVDETEIFPRGTVEKMAICSWGIDADFNSRIWNGRCFCCFAV